MQRFIDAVFFKVYLWSPIWLCAKPWFYNGVLPRAGRYANS